MTSRLIQFVTFVSPIWSTHDSTLLISRSRFPHHPPKKRSRKLEEWPGYDFLSSRDALPPRKNYPQETTIQGPKYAGICWMYPPQSDPTRSHRVAVMTVTIHHLKGSRFPHHKKVTIAELSGRYLFPNHPKKKTT